VSPPRAKSPRREIGNENGEEWAIGIGNYLIIQRSFVLDKTFGNNHSKNDTKRKIGETYAKYPGHRFQSCTAHRSGRDSQLLCYFSTRRFQANRKDVGFSRLKAKRLGLVDDFRTFRVEKPDPGLFEYVAA
jgi:hypothetical protein